MFLNTYFNPPNSTMSFKFELYINGTKVLPNGLQLDVLVQPRITLCAKTQGSQAILDGAAADITRLRVQINSAAAYQDEISNKTAIVIINVNWIVNLDLPNCLYALSQYYLTTSVGVCVICAPGYYLQGGSCNIVCTGAVIADTATRTCQSNHYFVGFYLIQLFM